MKMDKDKIINLAQVPEDDVVVIYPYGSRVYGTSGKDSDYDYIVVCKNNHQKDGSQFDSSQKDLSVHVYNEDSWQNHLNDHKIFAIESFFMSEDKHGFVFNLDRGLLRKEISSKASNSWVKCKKKLTVEENEYYIGIKSLFHSFRIPMFGIQIATEGKIVDYSVANNLWFNEILPFYYRRAPWEDIKKEFQPRHNVLMTKFRKVAEKV